MSLPTDRVLSNVSTMARTNDWTSNEDSADSPIYSDNPTNDTKKPPAQGRIKMVNFGAAKENTTPA